MSDNVVLNAGAGGATLATDDVGGVQYQVVKLDMGGDGVAAPVSNSNPVPVSDAGGSLTVDGTVAVTDGGGSLTVDGSVAITGSVAVTDNAGSLTVDNAGTFAVQAAQSGTWNIGSITTLPALVAGTANIGDVDVLTVPADPFGANADAASATGSISAKLRFIAATGIPITGTVAITANSSVNVAQLAGTTTDTNSGNKSAGTLRVVLATDQPALTNKLLVTPDANSAVNCAQIAGTSTAVNNGTASAGCQRVTIASDNTAFSVNSTLKPATSGGLTVATGSIAATKTDIKGSAGQVYGWYFYNPNASVAYVQFFNATAANVTLGTTAPVYSLGIPATSAANVFGDIGIPHGTAISIAVTTTRAGSTGPGSTVDYNIYYN